MKRIKFIFEYISVLMSLPPKHSRYDAQWCNRVSHMIDNCRWMVDFDSHGKAYTVKFDDDGTEVEVWCSNYPYGSSNPWKVKGDYIKLDVRCSIKNIIKLNKMFKYEIKKREERIRREEKLRAMKR